MLKLRALDHVGLVVSDLDRTLDFYRRLGVTMLRTSGPDAKGVRTAVLQVGEQKIISVSPSRRPGALDDAIQHGGHYLHHDG